jgi:hypothetical protein
VSPLSRTGALRIAAATLFVVAFALRRSELRVVRLLREQRAFERLNPLDRLSLRRLVRVGAATLVNEGRYAFIPDGYASFRRRRRVRALLVLGMLLGTLLVLWRRGFFAT